MRRIALLAVLALAAVAPAAANAAVPAGADAVTDLPTLGPVATPQFSGYASASAIDCADLLCSDRPGLFYWLVGRDANYRTQPTVLWSNGGPGASSFYGPLSENGPYRVSDAGQLTPYPDSWSNVANYLIFDHPLGMGMSFPFHGQIAQGLQQGTDELAAAVGHVVARDGLQQSPLFLTGESYGGTYMPRLAKRLIDTKAKVKIGGVVIVDGWVDPETQTGSSAEFALTHGLIDANQKRSLDRVYAQCQTIIRRHGTRSLQAAKVCQSIQDKIATMSGRWLANIGQLADVSYAPVEAYLNRPDVRAALHAQPGGTFSLGSDALGDTYAHDVMENQTKVVAGLLRRGVPVMVITGLNDAKDTNVIGVRRWIANMRWPGATRYERSANTRWTIGGTVLGSRRIGGGLTTLEVLNAGHLSPRDQPLISSALADFMAASPRG